MERRNYETLEDFIGIVFSKKSLPLQHELHNTPSGMVHFVYADEASTRHCLYLEDGSDDADAFLLDYLDLCNYGSFIPPSPFAADNMVCCYDGIELTQIDADVKRLYYAIPADNLYLNGGSSGGVNIGVGDWFSMSIVDHDNLLGYGVDFPLKAWVRKKFLRDWGCECHTPYAGSPPRYFYVMIEYHKVGSLNKPDNPAIWVQLDLHQKVI